MSRTGTEPTDEILPREFHHMQFTDIWWEKLLVDGFRVFVQYEFPDGELRWTQTNMFHSDFCWAYSELLQIIEEGIFDADDGHQLIVRKIIIMAFPLP